MHIELLVEEPSAEAALRNLVPRIVPPVSYAVHVHGGKQNLLANLPGRLRGYRAWIPQDWRLLVLVDRDDQECHGLKEELERAARRAGFVTRASARGGSDFQIVNRLAIEELEAWFFGDVPALVAAYPRVPATLGNKARYRDPDAVAGGTWQALQREQQRAGYYPGGLPKIEVARSISHHMDPSRNRSRSFQVFRNGLLAFLGG